MSIHNVTHSTTSPTPKQLAHVFDGEQTVPREIWRLTAKPDEEEDGEALFKG